MLAHGAQATRHCTPTVQQLLQITVQPQSCLTRDNDGGNGIQGRHACPAAADADRSDERRQRVRAVVPRVSDERLAAQRHADAHGPPVDPLLGACRMIVQHQAEVTDARCAPSHAGRNRRAPPRSAPMTHRQTSSMRRWQQQQPCLALGSAGQALPPCSAAEGRASGPAAPARSPAAPATRWTRRRPSRGSRCLVPPGCRVGRGQTGGRGLAAHWRTWWSPADDTTRVRAAVDATSCEGCVHGKTDA